MTDDHAVIETNIKWIVKLMSTGFSLVLAAVVYFNVTSQDNMIEIKDSLSEIQMSINVKSFEHERTLADLEINVAILEDECCTPTPDKESKEVLE